MAIADGQVTLEEKEAMSTSCHLEIIISLSRMIDDRTNTWKDSLSIVVVQLKRDRMNKAKYKPQPIDTTDVVLPVELKQLVEEMSKNVHEVWAETRIKQGWTYGEQRNDELKTHPCLVPYEDLPEEEKEYDRNTSIGTLKLIMKLGFKICQ